MAQKSTPGYRCTVFASRHAALGHFTKHMTPIHPSNLFREATQTPLMRSSNSLNRTPNQSLQRTALHSTRAYEVRPVRKNSSAFCREKTLQQDKMSSDSR